MPSNQHSEDPAEGSREVINRELERSEKKKKPEADAREQNGKRRQDGFNDGDSSQRGNAGRE
jgi:hypothetical protein